MTKEARAKTPGSKKISVMRASLKGFFVSTNAIYSDIALRRDLTVYLTCWLGEAVFAGGDGTHIRPHCIFSTCQMAFGERLALVPVLYSYLCTKLQAAAFLVQLGLPMNRVFSAHIFYSWDVEIGQSSVKLSPDLRKKAFDFGVSHDSTRAGSGRDYSLTNVEKAWLFNIRVGTMGAVGVPSSKVKRFGGLQDWRNAWAFYSVEDSTAMISYPELPTFLTVGFTKWTSSEQELYKEVPGEVLKQLEEEEAKIDAWIQADRAKASMESTGKSRLSSEDFSERLDFDGGAGTSSKPSHRSKRKRGQCRNKRRHEDSPDLEVPLTIAEEVSGDDDEPSEKRNREEEAIDDGDDDLMMPEVPTDEAVTDPIVASEKAPSDFGGVPKSSHGCEPIGEVPPSSSGLQQGVPAVDPEVGATSSFGATEMKSHDEIPSSASSIRQSLLTIPPMKHDRGSRPMERGLSGRCKCKAFVDEVIALSNKWTETKSLPNDDFFNEIFVKPSSEVKSEVDEISRTRKQFVQERNVTDLAIIELTQDLHRLDREVIEAMQRLELLEEQAAAKWAAITEARDREGALICQVEEADSNLRRKTQEYEQWQIFWEKLPRAEDGSQRSPHFMAKF
ncbi:hypothetical protein AAC387_Pa01g2413 [Persea americana]